MMIDGCSGELSCEEEECVALHNGSSGFMICVFYYVLMGTKDYHKECHESACVHVEDTMRRLCTWD